MKADAYQFRSFPGAGKSLMARILGPSGSLLVKDDVTSIECRIFENGIQTESFALDKEDVVFNTLQKDIRWKKDTTGYNFRYDCPPDFTPEQKAIYGIQITIVPVGGQNLRIAYENHTSKWEGA